MSALKASVVLITTAFFSFGIIYLCMIFLVSSVNALALSMASNKSLALVVINFLFLLLQFIISRIVFEKSTSSLKFFVTKNGENLSLTAKNYFKFYIGFAWRYILLSQTLSLLTKNIESSVVFSIASEFVILLLVSFWLLNYPLGDIRIYKTRKHLKV